MLRFIDRYRGLILLACLQVLPAVAQNASVSENPAVIPAETAPPISESPPTPFGFDELLDRARSGNPQWAAAQTLPLAAQGEVLQAGMRPNPVIGLGTGIEAPFRNTGTSLSWSQELELGGKRQARLEAAQARLEAAQRQAQEVERELLLELRNAYVELLYSQALEALKSEALELSERSLTLTRGRLDAGDVAGVDVMQFEVQVAQRRSEFEETRGRVLAAQALLNRLVGEPSGIPISVRGELGKSYSLPELLVLQQISDGRADLLLADARARAAEREIAVQETRGISNLTTTLGIGRERTYIDGDAISPRGIISNINDSGWTASLQLSIPLPINDTNRGNIEKARAEAEGTRLTREATQQIVRGEVAQAHAQWSAASRSLEPLQESNLENARQAQRIVEESYKLGYRTLYDVLQSRQQYLELRQAQLDARRSLDLALARIEAAIGQPLGDNQP